MVEETLSQSRIWSTTSSGASLLVRRLLIAALHASGSPNLVPTALKLWSTPTSLCGEPGMAAGALERSPSGEMHARKKHNDRPRMYLTPSPPFHTHPPPTLHMYMYRITARVDATTVANVLASLLQASRGGYVVSAGDPRLEGRLGWQPTNQCLIPYYAFLFVRWSPGPLARVCLCVPPARPVMCSV